MEPVPSREQLVGEGRDMDVLESNSSEERPGERSDPCCGVPCKVKNESMKSKSKKAPDVSVFS